MKLLLVCSTGGHLEQLWRLRAFWAEHPRVWVTFDKPDARERLAGEAVVYARFPVARNLKNLAHNTRIARRVLAAHRPDVLISNGAGVALPFFALAPWFGCRTVFIEVEDRVARPSLTGRLVAPIADRVLCTDPRQLAFYPGATLLGEEG
jgi:beta-1,4-N-acetylglucosaminyltransferase